jgi:hypothetical protein
MPWFVEAHILGAVLGPILARLLERVAAGGDVRADL